jgi:hypothetical protein
MQQLSVCVESLFCRLLVVKVDESEAARDALVGISHDVDFADLAVRCEERLEITLPDRMQEPRNKQVGGPVFFVSFRHHFILKNFNSFSFSLLSLIQFFFSFSLLSLSPLSSCSSP